MFDLVYNVKAEFHHTFLSIYLDKTRAIRPVMTIVLLTRDITLDGFSGHLFRICSSPEPKAHR